MTTISLLDTDHTSYQRDGLTFIDQDTFDLAIEHWMIEVGRENTDITSIYDGSSDVSYALAEHVAGEQVRAYIVQFDEEGDGYAVDSLPFFLEIAASVPEAAAEPTGGVFLVRFDTTAYTPEYVERLIITGAGDPGPDLIDVELIN